MSRTAFFIQECPTCGRTLQVRVTYLGKMVACKHCHAQFSASDPDSRPMGSQDNPALVLLDRVDALLASADEMRRRPR